MANQVRDISEIQVVEVPELKTLIIEKEKVITDKGGDERLFQFLKLDNFLQDYRNKIISDIDSVSIDRYSIERAIISYEKKDDLEKTNQK